MSETPPPYEHPVVPWLTPVRRAYIYRVVGALAVFLVAIGVVTEEIAFGVVALAGTLLSTGLAIGNTSIK